MLLLLGTLLLYHGDLDLGFFHLDDPTYVRANRWIQSATVENVKHILTEPYYLEYAPLRTLSYMVDWVVSDGDPRMFHLSNNIWAGVSAGGVYLLGLVLLGRWTLAIAAATLFVTHPCHVEAVVWISSRKDLVATAFTLPAMLTYFWYRRRPQRRGLYVTSLCLFACGLAGKLSVVLLPLLLFLFDLLGERRRGWGLVLDKIPYGLLALFFALQTLGGLPDRSPHIAPSVVGKIFVENLILLTGFGDYVLSRPPPDPAQFGWGWRWVYSLVPPAIAVFPVLLRRRLPPLVPGLIYWIPLSLIPPLLAGVLHPVNDRYLFFPSVAWVVLMVYIWKCISPRRPRFHLVMGLVSVVGLSGLWTWATLDYLAEWQDPRSLWYGARDKNSDVVVYQYLGTHFQDAADRLPHDLESDEGIRRATRLANVVWSRDERREPLIEEWQEDSSSGLYTKEFQVALRDLARRNFDEAIRRKDLRVLPNLYFRRAKLAMDSGDLTTARAGFLAAYEESLKHIYVDVRQELAVRCHHALGIVCWREGKREEALQWLKQAEAEQDRFRGHWIPDLREQRQRYERILKARQ